MNHSVFLGRRHYGMITAAFLLFVLYGSLVPLTFQPIDSSIANSIFWQRMKRGLTFDLCADWAANVMLFIPLGYLSMAYLNVDAPRRWTSIVLVPLFAILSALIEYTQIWFPPRDTNINDIVAETIGGLMGVIGWIIYGQPLTDRLRHFWSGIAPGDWAIRLLPTYLLFLVFVEGMPFDLTISPWTIGHKFNRRLDEKEILDGVAMAALTPPMSRVPEKTLMTFAYFVPLGVLFANLPGAKWKRQAAIGSVFFWGICISGVIEFIQLLVSSCSAYASDVILGALFVSLGWRVAVISAPLPTRFWIVSSVVWMIAISIVSWLPIIEFSHAMKTASDRLVLMPFREYIDSSYLTGINKMIHRTYAYVPFGFFIGRAIRIRLTVCMLAGVLLGLIVESGQLLLTEHQAGISDVLLGGIGSTFGGIVAIRASKFSQVSTELNCRNDFPPKRLL